jgi:hypothetical protein
MFSSFIENVKTVVKNIGTKVYEFVIGYISNSEKRTQLIDYFYDVVIAVEQMRKDDGTKLSGREKLEKAKEMVKGHVSDLLKDKIENMSEKEIIDLIEDQVKHIKD